MDIWSSIHLFRETKTKAMRRANHKKRKNTVNQWIPILDASASNERQARENARDRSVIGFDFASE